MASRAALRAGAGVALGHARPFPSVGESVAWPAAQPAASSSSAAGRNGKKTPPDQTPKSGPCSRAELDQAVEALAVDQRLEAAADHHVGRGLGRDRVADDADRVLGAGGDLVLDLGEEGEALGRGRRPRR